MRNEITVSLSNLEDVARWIDGLIGGRGRCAWPSEGDAYVQFWADVACRDAVTAYVGDTLVANDYGNIEVERVHN